MSVNVRCDRNDPPSAWCNWWADLTALTSTIYYGWPRDTNGLQEPNPSFWHWCPAAALTPGPADTAGRWMGASTNHHTLLARQPLYLEPSLLWRCCDTHGFVRDGTWTPA
ncbi:hypothetical protein OG824_32030 [Streptomyces prunicolor]|uniref:hypothetical protein n=1 Tax=Streptomyces prunicolor TaxID=67348 RepID=UPI002259C450|nr:hypothetical protein [Streptomyces prunicolor]MCX5239841.1 hypothetical protein [Streptomyces prunicolor]